MTAHIPAADGSYIPKELPGVQNIEDWCSAWDFASVGYVMADVLDQGIADSYKIFFKMQAENYPSTWWLAYKADWELRHVWAIAEKRRQEAFHEANPTLSRYDKLRPWNTVLLAGFEGMESMQFWEESFKEKARKEKRERHVP